MTRIAMHAHTVPDPPVQPPPPPLPVRDPPSPLPVPPVGDPPIVAPQIQQRINHLEQR